MSCILWQMLSGSAPARSTQPSPSRYTDPSHPVPAYSSYCCKLSYRSKPSYCATITSNPRPTLLQVLLLPPPGAPGADGKEAAAAGAAAAEALSFATGEAHTALGAPVKITLPAGLAKGAWRVRFVLYVFGCCRRAATTMDHTRMRMHAHGVTRWMMQKRLLSET